MLAMPAAVLPSVWWRRAVSAAAAGGTAGHTHARTQRTRVVTHLYTCDRFGRQAHASSVYLAAAAIELTVYISVTRQAIKYPPQGWPGWHWIFMTADFSNYQME